MKSRTQCTNQQLNNNNLTSKNTHPLHPPLPQVWCRVFPPQTFWCLWCAAFFFLTSIKKNCLKQKPKSKVDHWDSFVWDGLIYGLQLCTNSVLLAERYKNRPGLLKWDPFYHPLIRFRHTTFGVIHLKRYPSRPLRSLWSVRGIQT